MRHLSNLSLAGVLAELRTADRLEVAITPMPAPEAALQRAALESARAERRAELARRAELTERARAFPARHG